MENIYDAFVMLSNSGTLRFYCFIFFFSVALYNVFAVFITKLLNSIWHAILDNFRPIAVWATDLVIYYAISNGRHGENWVWPGSYLQFFGMLTLFFGTAVYNGSVPWIGPTEAELDEDDIPLKGAIQTPTAMASPMLMRSPLIHRRSPAPQKGINNEKGTLSLGMKRQNYGALKNEV
eukprot:TRINITY_DN16808_c0_g1_i4.p1 TRINITY_DN16808_c0_g1~~TRINITY_DN16808_c0_g1_i4.p1  ORF type:complete len:177 (+),score=4.10 TRINITY_DN16808_c0_g1_i4:92-622(+)